MVDYVKLANSFALMSGNIDESSDNINKPFKPKMIKIDESLDFETKTKSVTLTEVTTSYNDRIITCDLTDLQNITYDPNQKTILKLTAKLTEQFNDFEFCFEKENYYVYLNKLAKQMCPTIIDGKATGSATALIVNCDQKQYVIFVKDRTKKLLTLPTGTRNNPNESYEDCARREVEEETGYKISTELIKCASWSFISTIFNMKFDGQTIAYYTNVTITEDEMNKIKSHNDAEIEYVKLVNITNLDKLKFDTFSQHHVMIARHSVSKVNEKYVYEWSTDENKPKYLQTFNCL